MPGDVEVFFSRYRDHRDLHSFPTRRSSDLAAALGLRAHARQRVGAHEAGAGHLLDVAEGRSEEHTSELQSHVNLVCRLLLEKKKCEPGSPAAPAGYAPGAGSVPDAHSGPRAAWRSNHLTSCRRRLGTVPLTPGCREMSKSFFHDTATTAIYTLSLHDALPIWRRPSASGPTPASALVRTKPVRATSWMSLKGDRKSTRLNSSHMSISYAVFCLKKKNANRAPRLHRRATPRGRARCRTPTAARARRGVLIT